MPPAPAPPDAQGAETLTTGDDSRFFSTSRQTPALLAIAAASLFTVWISLLPFPSMQAVRWVALGLGACALGAAVVHRQAGFAVVLSIVTLYLALRLPYFVASGFQLLPFGDSYWDFAVLREFLANGRIGVVPASDSVAMQMTWYSSWPLLHATAAALVLGTGASPLAAAIGLTLFLGAAGMLTGAALAQRFLSRFGAGSVAVVGVLFFFAVFPENIFWSGSFVRQNYAFPLFLILLLAILDIIERGYSRAWTVVLYVSIAGLALAHHFSSLTFLILMGLIAALWRQLPRIQRATPLRLERTEALYLAGPMAVGASLVVVWWTTVADVILSHVQSLIRRYARLLLEFDGIVHNPSSLVPPEAFSPAWLLPAEILRSVLVYGTAAAGFFYIFLRARDSRAKTFLVSMAAAFGVLFVVLLFWTEPYRLLAFAVPLIAVCFAALLEPACSRSRSTRAAAAAGVACVTVLAGTLLWAHSYAPTHLSGPASAWNPETGEHWLGGPAVGGFVAERLPIKPDTHLYADDVNPLTMTLDTEALRRLDRVGLEPEAILEDDDRESPVTLVSTRGLFTYEYYASTWTAVDSPAKSRELADALRAHADRTGDRIYDAGLGKVWILRPAPS